MNYETVFAWRVVAIWRTSHGYGRFSFDLMAQNLRDWSFVMNRKGYCTRSKTELPQAGPGGIIALSGTSGLTSVTNLRRSSTIFCSCLVAGAFDGFDLLFGIPGVFFDLSVAGFMLCPFLHNLGQRPRRLRQSPETLLKSYSPSDEKNVVSKSPSPMTPPLLAQLTSTIFFSPDRWSSNCDPRLNPPPKPRQPGPITEGMCRDHRDDVAGSNEDECGVPAEHGGVGKLKERADDGGRPGRVRVCQDELVEMVDMRYTKVKRRKEDDARW